MPDIVGIRFKKCGKIYDFEVNNENGKLEKSIKQVAQFIQNKKD